MTKKKERRIISFGNKKAVLDSIFIAVAMVILMIIIVFGYKLLSSMNANVQTMDQVPAESKLAIQKVDSSYLKTMDMVFLFFWLSSLFGALISAWFIDTHPAFFVLSIIVIMAIMVGVVPLANVTESILTSSELATSTAHFSIIVWVMQHFFTIILIQSFLIAITLYSKMREA
jgi:hypothetical protein